MNRCENCGSSNLSNSENALCDLCFDAQAVEDPDEWDSTVAFANTGSGEDYSYLDDYDPDDGAGGI